MHHDVALHFAHHSLVFYELPISAIIQARAELWISFIICNNMLCPKPLYWKPLCLYFSIYTGRSMPDLTILELACLHVSFLADRLMQRSRLVEHVHTLESLKQYIRPLDTPKFVCT